MANDPPIETSKFHIAGSTASSKRRRRNVHSSSSSSVYLASVAALAVVVSCLLVSPTVGFTSSEVRPSAHKVRGYTTCQRRIAPFAVHSAVTAPFGRLYMVASSGEKEEWRAILSSFQLYKAAYGDLKIPTRFVVPKMQPWPGKIFPHVHARVPGILKLYCSCFNCSSIMYRGRLGYALGKESVTDSFRGQVHREQ